MIGLNLEPTSLKTIKLLAIKKQKLITITTANTLVKKLFLIPLSIINNGHPICLTYITYPLLSLPMVSKTNSLAVWN